MRETICCDGLFQIAMEFTNSSVCQVNESNYDDRTALHIAASMGHKSIVKTLVERYNASASVKDRYGGTPLDDAIREGHAEIAMHLAALQRCDHGQLPVARYTERLIQAAAEDDLQYVKTLLLSGMDCNCADCDNRTPLHLAVSNASMRVLRFMLERPETQVGPIDNMGHTPMWDALCIGSREAVSLLRPHGAPVQPDIAGDLCKAAAKNNAHFFELLRENRIDTYSKVTP